MFSAGQYRSTENGYKVILNCSHITDTGQIVKTDIRPWTDRYSYRAYRVRVRWKTLGNYKTVRKGSPKKVLLLMAGPGSIVAGILHFSNIR